MALSDDAPLRASRPLEAVPLPSSEPAAVIAAAAGPITEVISRDAPVDPSIGPVNRERSPDDPLLVYLNAPERSDRWFGELVERFYLSGMALNRPSVLWIPVWPDKGRVQTKCRARKLPTRRVQSEANVISIRPNQFRNEARWARKKLSMTSDQTTGAISHIILKKQTKSLQLRLIPYS